MCMTLHLKAAMLSISLDEPLHVEKLFFEWGGAVLEQRVSNGSATGKHTGKHSIL